ncbi:SDR family oxidoreductase [Streptomyces sp. NPDC054796]
MITGASGFLGSHVLRELLAEDAREPVTVLGRGAPDDLRARVESAVASLPGPPLAPGALGRVRYLGADLALPGLGLGAEDRARATAGMTALWHCAALTSLQGDPARLFETNVRGTRAVLELADHVPEARLLHVSTAFVAGKRRSGHVMEDDLSEAEGFQTYYEETKYTAERMVHDWAGRGGRVATVLRPSILVSDRPAPEGSPEQTLDVVVRLIDDVLGSRREEADEEVAALVPARGSALPFRAVGVPGAAMNALQVDYAARAMVRVAAARRANPAPGVRTVHVTHPRETPFQAAREALEETCPGLRLSLLPTVPAPTRHEALAMEHWAQFSGFSTQDRTYDRTHLLEDLACTGGLPDPAPLDSAYLRRAIERRSLAAAGVS